MPLNVVLALKFFLHDNNIGSDGAVALADALKSCTSLKVLVLKGNNIGSDDAVALAGLL